jgi:hypothetical protein
MSREDADRFRQQAEECRQQAARSFSVIDKEAWLKMAQDWLALAQQVDDRHKPR